MPLNRNSLTALNTEVDRLTALLADLHPFLIRVRAALHEHDCEYHYLTPLELHSKLDELIRKTAP